MQSLIELRFLVSCTFQRKNREKLNELASRVSALVERGNIIGIERFVDDLRIQCQQFIQDTFHVQLQPYDFRILNSSEYSRALSQFRAGGVPLPPIYSETQAITIAASPFLILMDIVKILREATGSKPEVSFLSVLVLTLMEELLHVLHFEWNHERIHKFARLSAEKFLSYRLPGDLIARISPSV